MPSAEIQCMTSDEIHQSKKSAHENHDHQYDDRQLYSFLPCWPGDFAEFAYGLAKIALDGVLFLCFLSQVQSPLFYSQNAAIMKGVFIQARQESNPQPLVLETSALPIELLAYELFLIVC